MKKIIIILLLLSGCCYKQKYYLQGQYDEISQIIISAEKGMFDNKSIARFWLKTRKSLYELEAIEKNIKLKEEK